MRIQAAIICAILFVAAAPQLIVEIQHTNQETHISGYEQTNGPDPTRNQGAWILELLDYQSIVVSQTRFDPGMILPDGTYEPLQTMHVPIAAPATATSIALRDEQGTLIAGHPIISYCGDGRCDLEERGSCAQDCAQEITVHEQELLAQQQIPIQEGLGIVSWLGIIGASLLIIILILVLVHLNHKKTNPVQLR